MNLDEQAINAVKEYFESIAQNAIDISYEAIEAVNQKINQFSSELVASEVLHMSARSIEGFNAGEGVDVDDVQGLIESNDGIDADEDEEE